MEWWLGYISIGAAAGFFAGLLGIGGGGIIVPLLVMLFAAQGLPSGPILHLAVGTAMATILFTSLSSMRAHAMRGSLRWDIAGKITPGILFGSVSGALVAGQLSKAIFGVFFTALMYFAATLILVDRRPSPSRRLPGAAGMFAVGTAIGALSALAAIGGAFMTVPFLLYCNVAILPAIGTAAVVGFPIALGGAIGYVASGLAEGGLPAYSLGYVYLPALAGITVASMLFAPLGAAAAHRLPTLWLKRIFAVLLYGLATRMLVMLW